VIRTIIAVIALAASAQFAFAATDDELRQQIVGPWGQDAECAAGSLTFNADGTFTVAMPEEEPETGTWTISGGILTGSDQPDAKVTIEGDSLALSDPKGGSRVERFNRCPA
jgi:hypothetical protein